MLVHDEGSDGEATSACLPSQTMDKESLTMKCEKSKGLKHWISAEGNSVRKDECLRESYSMAALQCRG